MMEIIDKADELTDNEIKEFLTGVEDNEVEEIQPFDPEKISIDTKPVTMDTCLRRLEQNTIILNPDFQRNEVWTDEKKCRLIESLILKIPLPMFYVSSDEQGNFYVVDGLQRLSTIRSFVLGDEYLKNKDFTNKKGVGFRLGKLEFWGKQYNGLNFKELPINIQNRIQETGFTFTIINPGTPEDVKRNIFKRINTGGEPLTAQEIRHALYIGSSTRLLLELSQTKEFLEATHNSVKSNRMMDREIILRALSFMVRDHNSYPRDNDMDSFLSDTMRIINIYNKEENLNSVELSLLKVFDNQNIQIKKSDVLSTRFITSMVRAKELFGEHAFRKSYPGKRRTPINKGLFELWGNLLGELNEKEYKNLKINKRAFLKEHTHLLNDQNFIIVISRDSQKLSSVKMRYDQINKLLDKYIND